MPDPQLPDNEGALVEVIEATVKRLGDRLILAPATVTRTDKDGVDPAVTLTFDVRDGQLECTEVVVTAAGRGIKRRDIGRVDIEAARDLVAEHWTLDQRPGTGEAVLDVPPSAESRTANRRNLNRTRRRLDEATLRQVAEVYTTDTSGAPTQAVSDRFKIAHRTASLWIRRARDAGLLEPLPPHGPRGAKS